MMARGDWADAAQVTADGERIAPDYWNIWVMDGKIAEHRGDLTRAWRCIARHSNCTR